MRTVEHYGPVTLSIIDQGGSEELDQFVEIFSGLLAVIDPDQRVALRSETGPDTVEIALIADGYLVRPDSIGLHDFVDLFEDLDSPVAGWIDQDTLNAIRSKLTELFGARQ